MANCTDDNEVLRDPFYDRGRRSKSGNLTLFDVKNPIPDEITDTDQVSKFFETYRFVPFAGSEKGTGDKTLAWYLMLAKLSSTFAACVGKLKSYVVGSKAKVVIATDPEYDVPAPDPNDSEVAAYLQKLKEVVEFEGGVIKFHELIFEAFKNTGNAFAELVLTNVNGIVRAKIIRHKTTTVRYKVTEPGQPKVVGISPVWTAKYLKKNPAKLRPLFPVVVNEGGVLSTVFHLKNGDNEWYGRPDSEGSTLNKYRQVQDAVYLIKQAASNFVGQLIIEVEDDTAPVIDEADAQRSGFDSFAERFEQNFTMKGDDPQAVLVTSRPIGARPMNVFQVKPNTNQDWYKVTGEIDETKIITSMNLTRRFMGLEVGSGLSETAFLEDYITNVDPVVRKNRATLMNFTNWILSAVWEFANMPEMNKYSLDFESPVTQMIQDFQESKKAKQQQPTQTTNANSAN